jgi:uncharacterized protein
MPKQIGFLEAFSIGVGGMVGGGIFAVLGLTIVLAKGAAPLAFALAGLIALVTVYSYVKLSLRYPSEGGTIAFIVQAFGNGLFSSLVNTLMLMGYVVMLALYAYAFGSYGAALLKMPDADWVHDLLAAGVIIFFTGINLFGAFMTGRAEDVMVFVKLAILVLFAAAGFDSIDWHRMAPAEWMPLPSVAAGGFIIFLAYEGFELIANTARDIKAREKNLPRAYYAAVAFVIVLYIVIAAVAVGNLGFSAAEKAKDYALAEAARPFFGHAGFVLIAVAALLSTASAINATLYGGGRTGYLIAKLGELPEAFETKVRRGYKGMPILGVLGIFFAVAFDLHNISVAGSLAFLTVFMLVNLANFRLHAETGGNRLVSGFGTLLCFGAAAVLVGFNALYHPTALISSGILIAATALFTLVYVHFKKRVPPMAPGRPVSEEAEKA